jgi:hypothetical protein
VALGQALEPAVELRLLVGKWNHCIVLALDEIARESQIVAAWSLVRQAYSAP